MTNHIFMYSISTMIVMYFICNTITNNYIEQYNKPIEYNIILDDNTLKLSCNLTYINECECDNIKFKNYKNSLIFLRQPYCEKYFNNLDRTNNNIKLIYGCICIFHIFCILISLIIIYINYYKIKID
jgi:hypothetical protein